jgi:selenide,water dikinase
MCALNGIASRAALAVGSRCATDITGFGLLGHAHNIAEASRVTVVIHADRLPVLPGTEDAWRRGVRTGGAERNTEFLESRVEWGAAGGFARDLAIDPQTSGGLLVAVAPPRVEEYLSLVPSAVAIGEVVGRGSHGLVLA